MCCRMASCPWHSFVRAFRLCCRLLAVKGRMASRARAEHDACDKTYPPLLEEWHRASLLIQSPETCKSMVSKGEGSFQSRVAPWQVSVWRPELGYKQLATCLVKHACVMQLTASGLKSGSTQKAGGGQKRRALMDLLDQVSMPFGLDDTSALYQELYICK